MSWRRAAASRCALGTPSGARAARGFRRCRSWSRSRALDSCTPWCWACRRPSRPTTSYVSILSRSGRAVAARRQTVRNAQTKKRWHQSRCRYETKSARKAFHSYAAEKKSNRVPHCRSRKVCPLRHLHSATTNMASATPFVQRTAQPTIDSNQSLSSRIATKLLEGFILVASESCPETSVPLLADTHGRRLSVGTGKWYTREDDQLVELSWMPWYGPGGTLHDTTVSAAPLQSSPGVHTASRYLKGKCMHRKRGAEHPAPPARPGNTSGKG